MNVENGSMLYLDRLVNTIHTTVLATVGSDGYPHTCAADMMYFDERGLYFLTARGKSLYRRLTENGKVSITGIKGEDTMSSVSMTVVGEVEEVDRSYLDILLRNNPYMLKIYPTEESRKVLTVFRVFKGAGEWFDLSKRPIERSSFEFGGMKKESSGYTISNRCIGCGACSEACPQNCIDPSSVPYKIIDNNCLRCGRCFEVCPSSAVIRS